MDYQGIRRARKAAGKSQDDLAQYLGVNRATISKYETGVIEPSISQLVQISNFLGVDPFSLMDFDTATQFLEKRMNSRAETLLSAFDQLNDEGQNKAVERVEELTEIPKYQKEKPPQD